MSSSEVPFISVVIPTYNMRELLRDAVESLFRQTYPKDRYEIIVVDNSSTDGTEELMQSLQQGSPCELSYYRKENEGPGASRNLGIARARGSIIAFTDSDCVADPEWLRNGAARMNDGVGLVLGKTLPNPHQPERTLQRTQKILSENGFYQTCNIFYRQEALEHVNGFSPEFSGLNMFGQRVGDDADLAWRVKERGWKSIFADDSVVYHHRFPLSIRKAIFSFLQLNAVIALPRLVKKHPALRNVTLYLSVFTSKQRFFFYLSIISLILGTFIHPFFFLLCLPYIAKVMMVSFSGRSIASFHKGIALFFIIVLHELIESILLIFTSLINRTLIL